MTLSKLALAAAIVAASGAMTFAPQSNAAAIQGASGKITIKGNVTDTTCQVNGGTSDLTVTLPTVTKTELNALQSAGAYTGATQGFTLALTGCPVGSTIGAQFYSTNADNNIGNGTLKNASGGATNVDVQIVDDSSNAIVIASTLPTDNSNVTDAQTVPSSGDINLDYTAQYYVTGAGSVTAGTVTTTTQYVLNYQ